MAHLFHVGAGSGGMVVLDLVARDPRVTRVTLVEPDVYQSHNVHRHLFPSSAVGRLKSEVAAEWLRDRRSDLRVDVLPVDLTAPAHQDALRQAVSDSDIGVCAVDNEPAKYHFDLLLREFGKPWTLGEVLSGGIGGWVHRFMPSGPCYGCVASYMQRDGPNDRVDGPRPDYANPGGPIAEATVPAGRASIATIAGLHAAVTLDLMRRSDQFAESSDWTSLLFPLARVPGVFDEPYRPVRVRVAKNLACLICSSVSGPAAGEDLDVALDYALARLGHE